MKATKQQIEDAYFFLEAMFSEFPNTLRKSGYVAKMELWELSYEQLKKLMGAVTDEFDTLPSIKALNDFRLTLFGNNAKRLEDAEAKSEAEKCYNDHIRGLCATRRGKTELCKHCDGKNYPGVRPETMQEMITATKGLKPDSVEFTETFEWFQKKAQSEQKEDLRKFERRQGSEPLRLEVVK